MEAHRHDNVYGLPGALWQTALETDAAQFSRSLGPERRKRFLSQLIALLPNNQLVLSWWSHWSNVHDDSPGSGAIREQFD